MSFIITSRQHGPSRRSFLKHALAGAAATHLLSPWQLMNRALADGASDPFSPITELTNGVKQTEFNGDDINRPHDILWDKDGYLKSKGGMPPVSERIAVAVVGGGMAGLSAAYELRDLRPLVLEGAPNFGGNSRGERWKGVDYSLGAAYITIPEEGSRIQSMLRELGLLDAGRRESAEGAMALAGNSLKTPFWSGATDPARAAEFERVWKVLTHVRDEAFPDIPPKEKSQLTSSQLSELDRLSFTQWIAKTLGQVHPHIDEFFHEYCWSSFAADCTELSAAQALNFLAGDLGGTIALPGGNAAITRGFYEKLKTRNGSDLLRAGAFVIDVSRTTEGVRICYENSDRKLKTVLAQSCVVACPKVAARYVISGLSKEQDEAMKGIHSRAYLVANILIQGRVPSPGYDVFRLADSVPTDPKRETDLRPFTDLIFAGWAGHDRTENSVLTLYKGLPYDGARQYAFSPFFYERHKGYIETALPSLLTALGVAPDRVADIRMTRWGHALPIAATGLYSSGALERASAPMEGRIFFAQQDNYANPSFESAVGSAILAATGARRALG